MEIITNDRTASGLKRLNMESYGPEWWEDHYGAQSYREQSWAKSYHARAARMIGNDSVVDIGCGEAWIVGHLAMPEKYMGVDWSETVIERARARWPDAHFSADDFWYLDCRFDWAVAFEVFEHQPAPQRFVNHLLTLAPRVLLTLPKGDWGRRVVARDRRNLRRIHGAATEYHFATYVESDIADMFPGAVFFPIDPNHIMFTLTREAAQCHR